MISRSTSIEAYLSALRSGNIKGRNNRILAILHEYGPLTVGEISKISGFKETLFSSQMSRLRDRGLVFEVGERICELGHPRILYDVTEHTTPKKIRQKITYYVVESHISSDTITLYRSKLDAERFGPVKKINI